MSHIGMITLVVVGAVCLGGCARNLWEQGYRELPLSREAAVSSEEPRVRPVEPQRMLQALDVQERFLQERSRHRLDLTVQEQRELQRLQFPVLRVSDAPEDLVLVGESSFAWDEAIAADAKLTEFARTKGASLVVVSVFPPTSTGDYRFNLQSGFRPSVRWGPVMGNWHGLAWYYAPLK